MRICSVVLTLVALVTLSGLAPMVDPMTLSAFAKAMPDQDTNASAAPSMIAFDTETLQMVGQAPPDMLDKVPDPLALGLTDIEIVNGPVKLALASLQQVYADRLNVYAGPSPNFPVITVLDRGEWATVMGATQGRWVPIRARVGGYQGWVDQSYLGPIEG